MLSLFTPEKAPRVSGPTQFKFALPKGLLVCYLFQQITNLFEHKSLCCAQSCLTLQPHELHVACQAPASMGISKQEYWSGLLLPPPGDLPDPGIEPTSPALAGGFFITANRWLSDLNMNIKMQNHLRFK